MILLLLATIFWIAWVIKNGKADSHNLETITTDKNIKLTLRSQIILIIVVLTFSLMVYGILQWDWDYNQMSALFLVMGIACGFIGKLGLNGTCRSYATGFREMAFAAVLVGLARSIYLILHEGMIIDTIVHGLFNPLEDLPVAISALGMTIAQTLIHLPVSSNSGHAVLTTPILMPLADLTGMSRQIVILSYQYGGAMMDLISPSNGALLAVLTAANISYKSWFAFAWKPYLILFGIALVAIFFAILSGF